MQIHYLKDILAPRNQVLWQMVAFHGGYLNGAGFLATANFVSHVTGYGTSVGISLGQNTHLRTLELASAPLLFLLGAMVAGWLMDRRVLQDKPPRLLTGLGILVAANVLVCAGEYLDWFKAPTEAAPTIGDFGLLFLLTFACGLQNGLFTGLTEGKVRTTHLTGPATDIGLAFAKLSALDRDDPRRDQIRLMNWMRIKIVIAFFSGSMIAALVFPHGGRQAFVVPLVFSLFLWGYTWRITRLKRWEGASLDDDGG